MRPQAPIALLLLLATGLAGCAAEGPGTSSTPPPDFQRVTFTFANGPDGHRVPITLYRPEGATAEDPVPMVLQSHGWGGSRETRQGAFPAFTDAGLGVVSIDMRGHGEATGTSQARVADPRYETRDVLAVIDHVAGLDWVAKEDGADPVLGAMGESYGGATALLAAAFDPRIDAVVAENTWHDLGEAMAPNGVPKSAWFAGLWLSAAIQGRLHPEVRAAFEATLRDGRVPDGTRPGELDLRGLLRASSPANYGASLKVPSLFMQGVNDTLFDLGQALGNHAMLAAGGADVALVTHLGGHRLPTDTRPPVENRHPCGAPAALALAWFELHLLERGDGVEAACLTLDDGHVVRPGGLETERMAWTLQPLRIQPGNLTSSANATVATAEGEVAAFGPPTLTGTVPPGANGTVFWSLRVVPVEGPARTVNQQATPQRLAEGPFTLQLAAVALHLEPGERLELVVTARHTLFPAAAAAGTVVELRDLSLSLPIL